VACPDRGVLGEGELLRRRDDRGSACALICKPSAAGSWALIARALRPRRPRLRRRLRRPAGRAVSRTAPTARGPAGGRVRGAGRSTPSPLEILHALVEQPDSDHQPLATADEEPTGHLALTPPIDAPRRPVSRKGRPMKCPVKGRQAGHRRSSPERTRDPCFCRPAGPASRPPSSPVCADRREAGPLAVANPTTCSHLARSREPGHPVPRPSFALAESATLPVSAGSGRLDESAQMATMR